MGLCPCRFHSGVSLMKLLNGDFCIQLGESFQSCASLGLLGITGDLMVDLGCEEMPHSRSL